jgi:signal transduction histidine kinase
MAGLNLGMLQTFLDLILHQGKRLNRLISDLLDASRMMNRKLVLTQAQVNLAKVIESAVTSVRKSASESGSSVKLELDHSIFGVCDSYRIEQVVENLLTNAIKYGGGHPIEVALDRPDSNRIRIRVKDYGIGIPTEMQSKIFDRFERGGATISFAGLGLGLYIAREIVTAHQGTIRVESQPGHGALFIVEIPVNPI